MFGCALPNSHSRQSCHPSRWLLVLKESLRYTLHMIKGNLPTNHVSSKYRMNSLIWGNCRAATLTVCQTGRTKRTGTNAQCSSYSKETVDFSHGQWPSISFPYTFPTLSLPSSHTHTIHQLSLFIRSHAVHDELTDDPERAMDAIILFLRSQGVGLSTNPLVASLYVHCAKGKYIPKAHKPMKKHFGKPTNCSLN